jgi:hypothetical protein
MPACTSACTSEAQNAHGTPTNAQGDGEGEAIAHSGVQGAATPLDALAQAIANLSADDRAKLAAMLTSGEGAKGGNP